MLWITTVSYDCMSVADQHLSGTYPTVVSQGCQDCIQNQNTNAANQP